MWITLKVQPRTQRRFDLPLDEDQLSAMRAEYWSSVQSNQSKYANDVAARAIILRHNLIKKLTDNEEKVLVFAITTVSLWVGGTYWYKDRAPKASVHTRMRAFEEDGNVTCPKCGFVLAENGVFHVKPHQYSKTLNNPHFICMHCNAHVIVSSRREDYKRKQLERKIGTGNGELHWGKSILGDESE